MSSSAERAGGGASIDAPLTAWADAERTNDTAAPKTLRHLDFTAVGPAGFIVEREGWLGRYRGGDLVNDAFDWTAR